jgi:hypothetical protein
MPSACNWPRPRPRKKEKRPRLRRPAPLPDPDLNPPGAEQLAWEGKLNSAGREQEPAGFGLTIQFSKANNALEGIPGVTCFGVGRSAPIPAYARHLSPVQNPARFPRLRVKMLSAPDLRTSQIASAQPRKVFLLTVSTPFHSLRVPAHSRDGFDPDYCSPIREKS